MIDIIILSLGLTGFIYLVVMILYSFRMSKDLDNYMKLLSDTDIIVDGKSSRLETALFMTTFNLLIPLDIEVRRRTEYFNNK